MEPIYVVGHRNPDTDSIVSAMAYAALRNALGDREYVPARLGHLSDETQLILDRFGLEPPVRIKDVRTQICDLDFDTPPALGSAVTINRAWAVLREGTQFPAVPVTDDEGGLFGMLSPADIAEYDMSAALHPYVEQVPLFNLLSVLEGKLAAEGQELTSAITGEIVIALPTEHAQAVFRDDSIVLCGRQPDVLRSALEANAACVVLCQCTFPEELRPLVRNTCVICTPLDAYRASRLILQSIPISRVCRQGDLGHFHLSDYLDDVREVVLKSRYRSYPILDGQDKVVGTLSRFHLLKPRRKRVVLVDHNEFAQSVPGLDQANILEIIDHHRLADIQTGAPIYFRNEPVGSTATIVAGMYQEKGLIPSIKLAGLIAAAIVADTVIFKSPTCTARDRRMAERMAKIAGESLDGLGQAIFSSSNADDKSAKELLLSDFKDFHIAGHTLGIGQITCVEGHRLLARRDEFLAAMGEAMAEQGYAILLLMITDVLLGGSHLLCLGDVDAIEQGLGVDVKDHSCFLPQVVSRKKQIIPAISALWG